MCGFAGFYDGSRYVPPPLWDELLGEMGSFIQHRGPNDQGKWSNHKDGVGMVHQRLSIVDLSDAGKQPMVSASGRYIIAFNGEIYNHAELRKQSIQKNWRGHSDTETLLDCIEAYGLDAALRKTVGMFAIALWDKTAQELTLIRDRMGEKPLYYGWQQASNGKRVFLFGSEIKPLRHHPAFDQTINHSSLTNFIERGYVGPNQSIYQSLEKVPAGCFIKVQFKNDQVNGLRPIRYWSLEDAVSAGIESPFVGNFDEATNQLEFLLLQSIRDQQLADVPVGAFLSGGIDSSLVVALMQQQSKGSVKTFTIGFKEDRYNEAEHAKEVAKHLGTDHHELYVSAQDAVGVIPELSTIWDEPFADSSQIPTLLVSRLAKQHVTVSLSGDGGDELFGGYSRYFYTRNIWNILNRVPLPLRATVAKSLTQFGPNGIKTLLKLLPKILRKKITLERVLRGIDLLKRDSAHSVYQETLSIFHNPEDILLDPEVRKQLSMPGTIDLLGQMRFEDSANYLPGDILEKVDRASMATSLESRVPLLDHRIVEFAWTLPSHFLADRSTGKKLLRALLSRHVPKRLFTRPKQGFGVPIDEWLRGPLRPWAESLLNQRRLEQEGFFDTQTVSTIWNQHINAERNWHYRLWVVLMFQSWIDQTQRESKFSIAA